MKEHLEKSIETLRKALLHLKAANKHVDVEKVEYVIRSLQQDILNIDFWATENKKPYYGG